jgi:ankyrin repeat protein
MQNDNLLQAAKIGDLKTIQYLLNERRYVKEDIFGCIPLFNLELKKIIWNYIYDESLDVNVKDCFGSTPLIRAVRKGYIEVIFQSLEPIYHLR